MSPFDRIHNKRHDWKVPIAMSQEQHPALKVSPHLKINVHADKHQGVQGMFPSLHQVQLGNDLKNYGSNIDEFKQLSPSI